MGSFSAHENATAFHWSACQDSKYAFKIKLSDHALSPLRAFALTLAELFKVAIIAFGFGRLVLLVFFFLLALAMTYLFQILAIWCSSAITLSTSTKI